MLCCVGKKTERKRDLNYRCIPREEFSLNKKGDT